MSIYTNWFLKNGLKSYIVTHAKAVVRGESTVDNDLTNLENTTKDHVESAIVSDNGVHGVRYKNHSWQYKVGGTWRDLATNSGISIGDMKSVSVEVDDTKQQVVIRGTDPGNLSINNVVVAKWGGCKVVRKTGSAPQNPDDGVAVVEYQTLNQFMIDGYTDKNLVRGETYYYRWFPYSEGRNYNYGAGNVAVITLDKFCNLGIDVTWAQCSGKTDGVFNLTPVGKYERLQDSVGLSGGEDFNQFAMYGGRKRCMVADDGAILAYYGDTAYNETGKTEGDIRVGEKSYPRGTDCQIMVYQPKFYYKVVKLNNNTNDYVVPADSPLMVRAQYYIASTQLSGYKVHPAFVRNGVELPYVLLSAFEATPQDDTGYVYDASSVGTKLASISGSKPITGSIPTFTRFSARSLAAARGENWQISDIYTVSMDQLLFLIEYATMDIQSTISKGNTDPGDLDPEQAYIEVCNFTGETLGNETSISTDTKSVSYRGEENLWGNVSAMVDGINVYNTNTGKVYISNHNFADNTTAYPYLATAFNTATANGYVMAYNYNSNYDFMFIPYAVGGTSVQPVGDYYIQSIASEDITYCTWGGSYNSQEAGGLYSMDLSTKADYVALDLGARLVYKPAQSE